MELRLRDPQKIIDTNFGNWLAQIIKRKLVLNCKKYNFSNIDVYLNESETLKRLYDRKYSTEEIVIFASKNLKCDGPNGEIRIYFDNNVFVPGYDRWKLSACLKTINFGAIDLKGCFIFTDTFDSIASDINDYIRMFYTL